MENGSIGLQRYEPDPRDADPTNQDSMRSPGQRDPDRTRRAILDAATAEFVEKGFPGASVNEIADRANVNKRMLYHYFGKKDELYIAVLERVYASLRTAQSQLDLKQLPPAEAIEHLILFTWAYYVRHPEFLSLMIQENMMEGKYARRSERISDVNAPFMDIMNDIVDRGQKDGVFRKNIDPLQLYLTVSALGTHYVATRFTLSTLLGCDLASTEAMDKRVQIIIDVVLGYLRP